MEPIVGLSKDIIVGQLEPYVPSPNITPVAGSVMIGFGIVNLVQRNMIPGIVQICMGILTIGLGTLIK